MSKSWDYAELSKLAKENGGPENLVNILVESGKKQMIPWLGVALATGVVVTVGVQKAVAYLKEKRKESEKEAELAKQELIRGIKEYDESQQKQVDKKESEDSENE